MRILGIETSCDETAAAVVEDGLRERYRLIDGVQQARRKALNLRIVERHHLISPLHELVDDLGPDETGGAGDQDAHRPTVGALGGRRWGSRGAVRSPQ